ncbi:hypothetical protein AQJ91_19910 [Streptomyces dysideae]|uniref:HTH merR-type domain-containing protein n=1 Tax=Streptomyces dysideae TaxID=909626 RepID=A0A101UYP2_9ACTN|nr:hypothetical protein AQJ91_19910 [Streptomyces dysideae]
MGFPELIGGKDALVEQLCEEKYLDLADGYGFETVNGTAAFTGNSDGPALDVALSGGGGRRIEAAQYLIATGSAPWAPPIDGLEEAGYLTSTTAMELGTLPESLLVVGGNAVGLEQAQLFARLGTQVTVIEALERLAPVRSDHRRHLRPDCRAHGRPARPHLGAVPDHGRGTQARRPDLHRRRRQTVLLRRLRKGGAGMAMRTEVSRSMTVGELSRRTGVPVQTLREYTDLGLIYTLGRSSANYRLYTTDALWCVR